MRSPCQACTVGFASANHTELSCLAVGQLVSPYPVCKEKKCVEVTTSVSSMLAPGCMDLTSGDQCKVMTAGHTGGASTLTCIGILRHCSQASCAVDGIPSGMRHESDGIAFLESCYANCSDGYDPGNVTSPTLSCGSNGLHASDTTRISPVGRALSFPGSALLDDTVEGLDCSSRTLDEACVTCAGRYTAAGDTETTLTCVFDPELQGLSLEGSTHSSKLAPCDLSTLMPPSTVSHECPNRVFGESCTATYSDGNAAISGMVAATVLTYGTDGALATDPTLPYPLVTSCSTAFRLDLIALLGPRRDLHRRVPSSERNQWHLDVRVQQQRQHSRVEG